MIVDQAIFFIPFPCYSFLTVGLVVGGLVSLFQSGEREVVLLADVEHMVDVTNWHPLKCGILGKSNTGTH